MAENKRSAFAKETKFLNYWRNRYLGQIFGILCGCAYLLWCIFFYVSNVMAQVFLVLLIVVLLYHFVKAYNEELQTRAEVMILAHGNEFFSNIVFDYGKGINAKDLDAQDVVEQYNVRECYTVVSGAGFVIEEDWFYTAGKADFHITDFEGVVMAINSFGLEEGVRGKVINKKGKIIVDCGACFGGHKDELEKTLREIMIVFGADVIDVVVYNSKLYLWIATKNKIFYQFKLLGANNMVLFVQRIKNIVRLVTEIAQKVSK